MKIVIAVLIVIIAVLVVIICAQLGTRVRNAVRRDEYQRARKNAHIAAQNLTALEFTVDKIEVELDNYSDIESPLAAKIRQSIREYRKGRIDQTA
jgi:uncharacterized membrane protein